MFGGGVVFGMVWFREPAMFSSMNGGFCCCRLGRSYTLLKKLG